MTPQETLNVIKLRHEDFKQVEGPDEDVAWLIQRVEQLCKVLTWVQTKTAHMQARSAHDINVKVTKVFSTDPLN